MRWCARPWCSPQGDADRSSLHPWELSTRCSLYQPPWAACPMSHYLDSAPISAPADSNRLDWVLKVWQRPLWQLAAEAGREEKKLFQWRQCSWFSTGSWAHAWVTAQQHIHFQNLSQMEDITDIHLLEGKKIYIQLPFSVNTLLQVYIYFLFFFKQKIPFIERRNFYH